MTLRHFEKNRLVEYESAQSGMPDARHKRHFVPANGGFLHGLVVEYEPRTGSEGSPTGFSCGAVSSAHFVRRSCLSPTSSASS